MESVIDREDLKSRYLVELRGDRTTRSVRLTSLVVFAINTVFIGLDYFAFPAQFWSFFYVRMGLNAVIALAYTKTARAAPVAAQYLGIFAIGAMLLTVIFGTGGTNSPYYTGLVLAFVALPVLGTVTAGQAAVSVGSLFVAFVSYPLFTGTVGEVRLFVIHSLFLSGAGLASVASCALLDRVRFEDFVRRHELERARDELKKLDVAKSRFTANVHHELRTPLTLLLAPVEGMLSGDFGEVSEEQRTYLKSMHLNALKLLKLINNLLDLAKVESGQLELVRQPSDVGRLVEEIVTGAAPLAQRKGIRLEGSGLQELPVLNLDAGAIEKVVTNLVGNALKFTEPGGAIAIEGAREEDGGVHLVVRDSGIGLEADQLSRIFDRFAQADGSATRRHEGTGIGLSLAKELVEAHGGRIWAESEGLGHGSSVHVVLPAGQKDDVDEGDVLQLASGDAVGLAQSLGAVEAELAVDEPEARSVGGLGELEDTVERWASRELVDADEEAGEDEGQILEDAPDAAPTVLVVEDNPDMRRLLTFVVGREFQVRAVSNGRRGLEAVREAPPDLVLTDVMMPEMSGIELCRALKGDPATASIPVVLVTSKAEREMKIEGLELGADDYVAKPFHPRELLARVRSLIRLRQLGRALEERNWTLERMNEELERAMRDLKEAEVQVLQSERLAAVGELAAGVAHEVNNPVNFALNALRTLQSHVESLARAGERFAGVETGDVEKAAEQLREIARVRQEEGLDEIAAELRELMAIVAEGLARTQRLVGDLRDFAGSHRGEAVTVNVRRSLESTLQLLRRATQDAGVEVHTQLQPEPLLVEGDPGAVNQVFLNLLKNSTEAFEGRGGHVWVEACREDGHVVVRVRDDGPGLGPEVRERLFEPFFTTKEAGKGSGLGLSICRRIVREHGGEISAGTSASGRGAEFVVRLPALRVEGGTDAA